MSSRITELTLGTGRVVVALLRPAVVLAAGLVGCAHAPPSSSDAYRAGIQTALDAVRSQGTLPGITLAMLSRDGRLETWASGVENVKTGVPLKADAVMPAGSIGKQFFAATALALAHDGRIDLDARIDRWFTQDDWFSHVQNAHQLTLRLLLMHRGGVGDHRPTPQFAAALHEAFTRQPFDPDFRIPAAALIDMLRDQAPLFAAGQGFAYSESGYLLAGLALERECGCRYYDELERRFLKPLKLDHTRPAVTRDMPNLVNGHIGDKLEAIGFPAETVENGRLLFNPATEWTGGGLYSNAADLVRWSKALCEGKALRGSYLDELLAKDAGAYDNGQGYGLGVRVMQTTLGTAYGHAGEFPGYVSLVLYFPDSGRAIALQANTALTDAGFLKDAALRLLQVAGQ